MGVSLKLDHIASSQNEAQAIAHQLSIDESHNQFDHKYHQGAFSQVYVKMHLLHQDH